MKLNALHQLFLKFPTVSTDSRDIAKNSLFFALKGPNFNGNQYAKEALSKGAAFAIIDEQIYHTGEQTILVDNVLETLQKLAIYHRTFSKAKIIALTGSNGKTTTKELIHAVLSKKYNTIATQGNLNNHIGVPLTLLRIAHDTEYAIIEMGANHRGEIAFLSGIAQPDYGYITNFGKAHLEGFGGVTGVIKGKSELYNFLIENGKYIFLNADDAIQKTKLSAYVNKFGFSTIDNQYYRIFLENSDPFVILKLEDTIIKTQLTGNYNFTNCAIAALMGKYFNIPLASVKEALEGYLPENNRSQILEKGGHKILLDAYNANPSSMQAALENFKLLDWKNKVVILGDMFELGEDALKEHQFIAELTKKLDFQNVFFVGENFYATTTDFKKFKNFEDLKTHLIQESLSEGSFLIKGSRGMALERVLELI